MTQLGQHLIDGLSGGVTYVLLGLGISLLFSIMGLINFSYGMVIIWCGYVLVQLEQARLPYVLAAALMVAFAVLLSVTIGVIAFGPFRGAPPSTLLLTSFGVELFLQASAIAIFGNTSRSVSSPHWLNGVARWGSLRISHLQIAGVVLGLCIMVGLNAVINRTAFGLHVRAVAEDGDIAMLLGVAPARVLMGVFALSGVIAGVIAALYVAKVGTVSPTADLTPTLKAFIVVIIGGLGTVRGAVIGGLLLGFAESFLAAYLPAGLTSYEDALVFALVILLLLVRPSGIAGKVMAVSN